jgi:lipopolysaccharide transport system permease protein
MARFAFLYLTVMARWWFLFVQWFKRDVGGRYRGLWLGLMWPIAQPLAQLAVFTLIFHGFMNIHWPLTLPLPVNTDANALDPIATRAMQTSGQSAWDYALNVLAGLAVFNFFAELLGRAPSAVLAQPSLVTKLRFPLMLLPIVTLAAAMIHIVVAGGLLALAMILGGQASLTMLWFPVWILPILLYGLAIALLLSSVGVYARDISQIVPSLTSFLMFLTPIFYPLSAVPESLHAYFSLNPIAWAAESLRSILLHGKSLELSDWGIHLALSASLCALSVVCFQKLSKGFSDVL